MKQVWWALAALMLSSTASAMERCDDKKLSRSSILNGNMSAVRGVTDVDPASFRRVTPEFTLAPYISDAGCGRRFAFVSSTSGKDPDRFTSVVLACSGSPSEEREGQGAFTIFRGTRYSSDSKFGDMEKDSRPLPRPAYQEAAGSADWKALRSAVCEARLGEMPRRIGG